MKPSICPTSRRVLRSSLVSIVKNADIVVLNEDFPNTEAPSWDGAPKAGVGVADVDRDEVFAPALKALLLGL